jgi:hypothetical protein
MEEHPDDAAPADSKEHEWPPLFSTPLLTALILLIVLPLLTLLILFLMWLSD